MGLPDQNIHNLAYLNDKLSDPIWRIFSGELYKIVIKDEKDPDAEGLVLPFKPNRAQRRFLKRWWNRNIILKARQLGFCVDPKTRVLTADLKWVEISSLNPGDEVIGVDEHPFEGKGRGRKMRTATVKAAVEVHRMAYRITFDDGREVVCTAQHPWLSKKTMTQATWRSIDGTGNSVTGRLKVGTKVRWIAKPWGDSDYEDGWFGGMLDGEGSISKLNTSAGINVSQREGKVWDRLVNYAKRKGYNAKIENDKSERLTKYGKVPVPKLAFGRMDEMFRLVGQTRPSRFLNNKFWEGRELPGKRNGGIGWATITKIEKMEVQAMIDLQTSTGTYIAEGFVSHNTTLICILWLDFALFNANVKCGIIAQDDTAAKNIFHDKIEFAYDNLPDAIKARFPTSARNAHELEFAHNGSSIRVATSMRSGTYHRLHVSEFGKICAKYPAKAKEVTAGSIPTVPASGILVIESTAEGRDGAFYRMTQAAIKVADLNRKLTVKNYRFHFFAWFEEPDYRLPANSVIITADKHDYFDSVESRMKVKIDNEQRAWYVATEQEFIDAGEEELMLQEYPSTPEEAFQRSLAGTYYAKEMTKMRKEGRICKIPILETPCNTFWDIGGTAGTALWVIQTVGMQDRAINYYEAHNESYAHFMAWLNSTGYLFNKHFLPHDADHKRQGIDVNKSPSDYFEELGMKNIEIVPVITNLEVGINLTKKHMSGLWIDEERCKLGIDRIDGYKRKWDSVQATWRNEPEKFDGNSEGADALRQYAQAKELGMLNMLSTTTLTKRPRNWRTI